jgi:pantoate--beta-alanine ligase
MILPVFTTVKDLRTQVAQWRMQGLKVALVPTMGALHVGHLSLIKAGFSQADRVIASIFVNPTQFGPGEDFDRYPRQQQADTDLLVSAGCSALYLPSVAEMYGPGFATNVTVAGLSQDLCGVRRPTHFSGVSTVVTKLLLQALPDQALFGEKDYQQLTIIRRTVGDLDIPVEIVGVETMRDLDGLAMSSRNRYLSEAERQQAPLLYQQLNQIAERLNLGGDIEQLCAQSAEKLLAGGFSAVDYLAVRDAETLQNPDMHPGQKLRILGAAQLGKARLIDNVGITVDLRKD